jgi:RNA polymerase sigma factor (sigma-70 family)
LLFAEALARLPDRMREVIVLKHCQGWTLERIAKHTERTIPGVASLLRRGLAQLRQELDDRSHPKP